MFAAIKIFYIFEFYMVLSEKYTNPKTTSDENMTCWGMSRGYF
jgi:hypothetical protein